MEGRNAFISVTPDPITGWFMSHYKEMFKTMEELHSALVFKKKTEGALRVIYLFLEDHVFS